MLVGPCEVKTVEFTDATGQVRQQHSSVHIKKCRYLDESRCVGMCVNMCKLPTQRFFTKTSAFRSPWCQTSKTSAAR
jgi:hypothetical protein